MQPFKNQLYAELLKRLDLKTNAHTTQDSLLYKSFKYMDLLNSGTINFQEFKRTFEKLGVFYNDEAQLQQVYNEYADQSGRLDYKTYVYRIFSEYDQLIIQSNNSQQQSLQQSQQNKQQSVQNQQDYVEEHEVKSPVKQFTSIQQQYQQQPQVNFQTNQRSQQQQEEQSQQVQDNISVHSQQQQDYQQSQQQYEKNSHYSQESPTKSQYYSQNQNNEIYIQPAYQNAPYGVDPNQNQQSEYKYQQFKDQAAGRAMNNPQKIVKRTNKLKHEQHTVDDFIALDRLKKQIQQRGARAIFSFYEKQHNYSNSQGIISIQDFEKALIDLRYNLTQEEICIIFRKYDINSKGEIQFQDLLRDLRRNFNTNRKKIVSSCWRKLDNQLKQQINIGYMFDNYSAKAHPDIQMGKSNEYQIYCEFVDCFNIIHVIKNNDYKQRNQFVTQDEFFDFYNCLSLMIEDDKSFDFLLRQLWNIKF